MTTTELVALAELALADALATHDAAAVHLSELKAEYEADETCAEAREALSKASTPDEKESAAFAEELAYQAHKTKLDAAYAEFGRVAEAEENLKRARHGLAPKYSHSNPASGTTQLDAKMVVNSEVAPPK